jgi:DNA repair protein SbcC/Rad50
MKLIRVSLGNFRQHAYSDVTFPERGVIGIVGANEGGKSTIIEAIAYALYGTVALRGSKSSVRWNRATQRRQATAELEFEIGGRRYTVLRTESDATLTDVTSGSLVPVAKGTAVVNEYVPRLLGMSFEEFTATFLCSQKDLARIATMKGTERRQFFLSVMGVGRVDAAITDVRAKKNAAARELDGMSAGLGSREPLEVEAKTALDRLSELQQALQAQLDVLPAVQNALSDARAAVQKSEEKRGIVADLEFKAAVLDERVQLANGDEARIAKEITEAQAARDRTTGGHDIISRLALRTRARDELRTARLVASQRATLMSSIEQLESHVGKARDAIRTQQAAIDSYNAESHDHAVRNLSKAKAHHAQMRDSRLAEHSAALNTIEAKDAELRRMERRISALRYAGPEGACPTCAQPLRDRLDQVIRDLQAESNAATTDYKAAVVQRDSTAHETPEESKVLLDIRSLEREVTDWQKVQERARHAVAQIERESTRIAEFEQQVRSLRDQLAAIPETKFDEDELAFIEADIEDLKEKAAQVERDRAIAARIPALELKLQDALTVQRLATHEAVEVREQITQSGFDKDQHADLIRAEGDARARMETEREIAARLETAIQGVEERVTRARKSLEAFDERAKQLEELQRTLRVYETADERLVQFRSDLAAGIRPEMEELVSGFVSILTDGRHESVSLNEDFELTLQESGVDVEVVSGGTEDIAAIAMRLAISFMIAERAGQPLSLLMLDETFASLDETRRENAIKLIARLRDTFEQVLLISHVPEVREKVDHVIEVTFNESEGRSYVTQGGTAAVPGQVVEEVAA